MNVHQNSRLIPLRRAEMARSVLAGKINRVQASQRCGVSLRTVAKWVARYRKDGSVGMMDRSSRPHHSPRQTAQPIAPNRLILAQGPKVVMAGNMFMSA